MFSTAYEVSNTVFTQRTKSLLLNTLKKGIKAYYSFIEENKQFLNHSSYANFFPAMRSYAIERQFALEAEKSLFPFTVYNKEFGLFKYKVSFINMDGVIISIAKTYKKDRLPSRSKYKIELSRGNVFENENTQISLIETDQAYNQSLITQPKYCIITYGIYEDTLTHARIIMPKSDYKGYILNLDLLEALGTVEKEIFEEKDDEINIVTIKSELENNYLKKVKEDE